MNVPRVALTLIAAAALADAAAQNPPVSPPGQPRAAQPAQPGRDGGRGRGGIRIMTFTSSAFADGAIIPAKYAQPGRDVSPPLAWSGAPDSTVSFVLVVHDLDAATGSGLDDTLHWLVWNISGLATSLPEGLSHGPQIALPPSSLSASVDSIARPAVARQISVSGPYYRGPAAPASGPPHHYVFELYALDGAINVAPVGQTPAATRAAVLEAMQGHVRAKGVLVGLFRRSFAP